MKQLFFFMILCLSMNSFAQNTFPSTGSAGIGTATPNASSLLDMESTNKGLLVPRVTLLQRNAIASPAIGLLIYQTNGTAGFYYFNGNAWTAITAKSKGWSLTGNSALNNTEFLGTTDTSSLVFKTDNLEQFRITATGNVGIGNPSPLQKLDVNGNINLNLQSGIYINNKRFIFFDYGLANSCFGYSAGNNATGRQNTFIGNTAGYSSPSGNFNLFAGDASGYSNSSGAGNVFAGSGTGYSNTSGTNNAFTGFSAGGTNTTGNSNSFYGANTGVLNQTGARNVFIGDSSGYNNTANNNTFAGYAAGLNNTSGGSNTFIGYASGNTNSTGFSNMFIGYGSGYQNTNGNNNAFNGYYSGLNNTSGIFNTAAGSNSLENNTTSSFNTAVGGSALFTDQTGADNTAVGVNALYYNIASNNTALGNASLETNSTGTNDIGIGFSSDVAANNLDNAIALGAGTVVDASNKVSIGNGSTTSIGGQVGWTNYSDERIKTGIRQNVPGLKFINLLHPVTYYFNLAKANTLEGKKNDTTEWKSKHDIEKINFTGLLVQDVDKAAKSIGYKFSGIDTSGKIWGLRYTDFVAPIIGSIQELSLQNDSLQNSNANQQAQLDALQNKMNEMQSLIQQLENKSGILLPSKNVTLSSASINQNTPNPFKGSTTIGYTLLQQYSSAQIIIHDNAGHTLKAVTISGTGKGSVNIDASTLSAGAYNYSLLIDGKLIGTKQMVLAK